MMDSLQTSKSSAHTEHRIAVLPAHLVNKIAAGEVVERPASVVKEMVENAIDAGSTRIEVTVSEGGRTLRIADNGIGMDEANARLAFCNHATSKIKTDDDLDHIDTLGFRGEALASIAAISKLTCYTRTHNAKQGLKVTIRPDATPELTPAGCAVGTVMEINELFYNTPARLKFLKRPATEQAHIEEALQALALSNPNVQFNLITNGKPVLSTAGSGDRLTTLKEVFRFRNDEDKELVEVFNEDTEASFKISGFVSAPGVLKSSKKWMLSFVNNRVVKCYVSNKAVEAAFESLIPHGKYPISVLFVDLPSSEVDVNVHPTKREVRYASNNTVFSFIKSGVQRSLENHGYTERLFAPPTPETQVTQHYGNPSYSGISGGRFDAGSAHSVPSASGSGGLGMPRTLSPETSHAALNFFKPSDATLHTEMQTESDDASQPTSQSASTPERFKVVGQLYNTYILLETPQGLMVVDQHIASERELFESLTLSIRGESPSVQKLVTSAPMALTPTQLELLKTSTAQFEQLGFEFELSETNMSVTLTGMPLIYDGRVDEPRTMFEDMLAQLEETGEMRPDIDLLIATLACHTAVRAGDVLTHSEMVRVVEGWLKCRLPWTCPHGRPIAHTIPKDDLNHFFHRPSLPVNSLG